MSPQFKRKEKKFSKYEKLAKIVSYVAPALSSCVALALGTVCIRGVPIADVGEEMEFLLGKKQRCRDTVHRRITPSLLQLHECTITTKNTETARGIIPHNRIPLIYKDGRNRLNMLRPAKSPYLRFQSYSKLHIVCISIRVNEMSTC